MSIRSPSVTMVLNSEHKSITEVFGVTLTSVHACVVHFYSELVTLEKEYESTLCTPFQAAARGKVV